MLALTDRNLEEDFPRDRLALLLSHFSKLNDECEPWRVLYPLSEVPLLVVCATIAACDDFDRVHRHRRKTARRTHDRRKPTSEGTSVVGYH